MIFTLYIPLASNRVRYGVVVIVALYIFIASIANTGTSPTSYGPFVVIESDKWSHGIGYAVLTSTLAYAFVAPNSTDRHRRLVLSVCLAVAFGLCMELVQWPIPYRTADEIDAIANTVGACLLAVVWWGLLRTVRFDDGDEAV